MNGVIGGGVATNANDPRRQMAVVGAGGLTMPSRDYYLAESEPYIGVRKALLRLYRTSFRRAGDSRRRCPRRQCAGARNRNRQAAVDASADSRDVVRMNHVMTLAELKAYAPGFPWDAFLTEMKFDKAAADQGRHRHGGARHAKLFAETPVADLQSYLLFHTLDAWADSLSEPWVQAHFDFHNKTLMDVRPAPPARAGNRRRRQRRHWARKSAASMSMNISAL